MSEWEENDEKAEDLLEIRCSRCPHWRLMEGALVTNTQGVFVRVLKVEGGGGRALLCNELGMFWADATPGHYFPVLSDPATLGCLRHLAAVAHGAWEIVIQVDLQKYLYGPLHSGTHGWWGAIDHKGRKIAGASGTFVCRRPTRRETPVSGLIAALEAAE